MIKEEIGRSYHSPNTDPIQWDHHKDLDVQYYGNDEGTWSVQINCIKPGYEHLSTNMHKFPDESSADHFARQQGDRIIRGIMNEKRLRNVVKNTILEVTGYGCNDHSLGFIDDHGEFIDLAQAGIEHQHYLDITGKQETPANWIKVSNANELWLEGDDWFKVTNDQIDGLMDMWVACSKYSNWIQSDIENFYVLFGTSDGDMEEFTVPEFIEIYGSREQIHQLFSKLLG